MPAAPSTPTLKVRVLYVSANPEGLAQINVDKEQKEIKVALTDVGTYRQHFEFGAVPAATRADLVRELQSSRPQILHITCHGKKEGLLLRNGEGEPELVPPSWLVERVKDTPSLRLVVFNACKSRALVEEVARETTTEAIGWDESPYDEDGRHFAGAFFRGIANGEDVGSAFRAARAEKADADWSAVLVLASAGRWRAVQHHGGAGGGGGSWRRLAMAAVGAFTLGAIPMIMCYPPVSEPPLEPVVDRRPWIGVALRAPLTEDDKELVRAYLPEPPPDPCLTPQPSEPRRPSQPPPTGATAPPATSSGARDPAGGLTAPSTRANEATRGAARPSVTPRCRPRPPADPTEALVEQVTGGLQEALPIVRFEKGAADGQAAVLRLEIKRHGVEGAPGPEAAALGVSLEQGGRIGRKLRLVDLELDPVRRGSDVLRSAIAAEIKATIAREPTRLPEFFGAVAFEASYVVNPWRRRVSTGLAHKGLDADEQVTVQEDTAVFGVFPDPDAEWEILFRVCNRERITGWIADAQRLDLRCRELQPAGPQWPRERTARGEQIFLRFWRGPWI